jgi:hypothetical protein
MSAPVTHDVLISGKVFGTTTSTDSDFPWMRGTFTPGPAFSEYESFVVPMEWDPEGEHLDLMALEASGVPLSEVQWGTPDKDGPTYLHALHLYNARAEAGWRFGPRPISFEDD